MSPTRSGEPESVTSFGDERDTVIAKANEEGIEWSIVDQFERKLVRVEIPNGSRRTRAVLVDAEGAKVYSTLDFQSVVALGSYEAVWHPPSGLLEAQLDGDRGTAFMRLSRLPEVTVRRPRQDALFEFDEDEGATLHGESSGAPGLNEWILQLKDPDSAAEIEISPAGSHISALGGGVLWRRGAGRPTLKIFGLSISTYDVALQKLEDVSSAFFFELDLKRNIALRLSRSRQIDGVGQARFRRSPTPLALPKKKYPTDAVSLYTYGRQALGMPLLQFLAFYQCIEYFFPQYWNAELIGKIRRSISDPRFDPDQDTHIGRLLAIGASRAKGGASERDQLRTTIDACLDDGDVEDFLNEDDNRRDALLAKNRLKGVSPLAPKDRNNRLTHQVAARIYDLRCRVVHAKEDGGPAGASEALLPFSVEADLLGADVELARFVAQKSIVSGRRGDLW